MIIQLKNYTLNFQSTLDYTTAALASIINRISQMLFGAPIQRVSFCSPLSQIPPLKSDYHGINTQALKSTTDALIGILNAHAFGLRLCTLCPKRHRACAVKLVDDISDAFSNARETLILLKQNVARPLNCDRVLTSRSLAEIAEQALSSAQEYLQKLKRLNSYPL